MRVYLSVDMEGIAGVNHPGPDRVRPRPLPGGRRPDGRRDQRRDRGRAGRRRDGHPRQRQPRRDVQPPAEGIHPAARVLQGQKAWSMVAGAGPDAGFDVALFVGYHARAGHPRGTIAHTYTGAPVETRLDGRPTGEYGLNAMILGAWGIPVGLVAGDDALAEEVADWLPWAERVVVKTAVGGNAAASVHPTVAADLIRAGAGASGPSRGGRRASSCCVSDRRSSSRSTTAAGSRPTTRRSCRAPSASATAASGSPPTTRSRLSRVPGREPAGQRRRSVTLPAASPRARTAGPYSRRWTA